MASTLTDAQLQIALKRPPRKSTTPQVEEKYDAALDELVTGMAGRLWNEMEQFPPQALRVRRTINRTLLLGDYPDLDAVRLMLAVVRSTKSDTLRSQAAKVLQYHVVDCSGDVDCSLKKVAVRVLRDLNPSDEPDTETKKRYETQTN